MRKKKLLFVFLLLLSLGCIAVGEWGLGQGKPRLEYAAPYSASQSRGIEGTLSLLSTLAQLREELPEAVASAYTLQRGTQVETASGRAASCAVYSIAEGCFDLYHRTLVSGRLLGEGEIQGGRRVAIVNTSLAYALWGDTEVVGGRLLLQQEEFEVVGVVEHRQEPGQTESGELYLPLSAAIEMGLPGEIQVLVGNKVRPTVFASIASRGLPGGQLAQLSKERMRAGLPLRYLCVLLLLMLLQWLLKHINRLTRQSITAWRKRQTQVYAVQMILPTLLLVMQWLACYGLWLVLVYFTLQCAVAPAYVFPEWIPEDPSRLSSYGKAIRNALAQEASLQTTVTEGVLTVRYYGVWLKAGTLLGMLALGMNRANCHCSREDRS